MRDGWALITGASGGIGRELALLAAADGWPVVLVARSADRLEALAAEIAAAGGLAEAVPADLAQPGAAGSLWDRLCGRPVGFLASNAGPGAQRLAAMATGFLMSR